MKSLYLVENIEYVFHNSDKKIYFSDHGRGYTSNMYEARIFSEEEADTIVNEYSHLVAKKVEIVLDPDLINTSYEKLDEEFMNTLWALEEVNRKKKELENELALCIQEETDLLELRKKILFEMNVKEKIED